MAASIFLETEQPLPKRNKPPDEDRPDFTTYGLKQKDAVWREPHSSPSAPSCSQGSPVSTKGSIRPASNPDMLEVVRAARHRLRLSHKDPALLQDHHGHESWRCDYHSAQNHDKMDSLPIPIKTYKTSIHPFQCEAVAFQGLASLMVSFSSMGPNGIVLLDDRKLATPPPPPGMNSIPRHRMRLEDLSRDMLAEYHVYRFDKILGSDHIYDPNAEDATPTWEKIKSPLRNTPKEAEPRENQVVRNNSSTTFEGRQISPLLKKLVRKLSSFFDNMAKFTGEVIENSFISIGTMQLSLERLWIALIPPAAVNTSYFALGQRTLRATLSGGIANSKCINSLLEDPG